MMDAEPKARAFSEFMSFSEEKLIVAMVVGRNGAQRRTSFLL